MKELIELHSLEFQVIKEQLKEEEHQRKSRQKNHVTIASELGHVTQGYFLSN